VSIRTNKKKEEEKKLLENVKCLFSCACRAFWGFAEHFKSQADALLGSLDPSKQKMLQGELSNSSSNNSLNSAEGGRPAPKSRARSASQDRTIPKYGTLEYVCHRLLFKGKPDSCMFSVCFKRSVFGEYNNTENIN
jgi:hypothetical protein